MQGSLIWLHQGHFSFISTPELSPFLADLHVQERRDERGSGGVRSLLSVFGLVHGSGEESGLPTIQPERTVQREVAVIDALWGILFDNL